MRFLLLGALLFGSFVFSATENDEEYSYRHHKRSTIDWVDAYYNYKDWVNLDTWKKKRALRDKNPDWRILKRHLALEEIMARGLECSGSCRVYRGEGHFNANYLSYIKEGDQIETQKESYLWLFMLDGSLLRISPQTIISFNEINVSKSEMFFNIRVTRGNVLWLSRLNHKFPINKLRETDGIFLPLTYSDANPEKKLPNIDEDNLYNLWAESLEDINIKHSEELNEMIEYNNKTFESKPTYVFISSPSGYLFGKDITTELIILEGNGAYLKNRSVKFFNNDLDNIKDRDIPQYYLLGNEVLEPTDLRVDQWYRVDQNGENIQEIDTSSDRRFIFTEFPTKRITSIITARELMLVRHSKALFDNYITKKDLAMKTGHKLWDGLSENKNGKTLLDKRLNFLLANTRIFETRQLKFWNDTREKFLARGDDIAEVKEFGSWAYGGAIGSFLHMREYIEFIDSDRLLINSKANRLRRSFYGR